MPDGIIVLSIIYLSIIYLSIYLSSFTHLLISLWQLIASSLYLWVCVSLSLSFLKILFIFRQSGREGEREGEKHHCGVASHMPPTGDLALNLGMCPDWESNQQPFGSQAGTQSTEPHQPGMFLSRYSYIYMYLVCTYK